MTDQQIPPSLEFEDAFVTASGVTEYCDFCGRKYYGLDASEEQVAALGEDAVAHECSFVPHGYISGKNFVAGCDCNALTPYERFVWKHRHQILKYLKKRTTTEKEKLETSLQLEKDVLDTINSFEELA